MEQMSGMTIYDMKDLEEGGPLSERLLSLFELDMVVPVLGAGFSGGLNARGGAVPKAPDLTEKLLEVLNKYDSELSADDLGDLEEDADLSTVSHYFVSFLKRDNSGDDAQQEFQAYINDHFTGVTDVPSYQRDFLQAGWPYLYTLCYDDAVEKTLGSYGVLIPGATLNRQWLKRNRNCVIKLHGDAEAYLRSGEIDSIVLSKSQYSSIIMSPENASMRGWLTEDLASKALLFIGCSLNGEYDFLFTDGRGTNRLASSACEDSLYVYYDLIPGEKIPMRDRARWKEYGIQNVIRVTPERMADFYRAVADLRKEAGKIRDADELERYTGLAFSMLDEGSMENIDYLFTNQHVWSDRGRQVTLPSFFIRRDIEDIVLEGVCRGVPVCAIAGRRFSGKTYFLLGLTRSLIRQGKKVYYFGGGVELSDAVLPSLNAKTDCVMVFDAGSLSERQVKEELLPSSGMLRARRVSVVCAIDASEGEIVRKLATEMEERTDDFLYRELGDKLSGRELGELNERVGALLLVDRRSGESFLDYATRLDELKLREDGSRFFNNLSLLTENDLDMVKCLIALALISPFSSSEVRILDIQDAISKLCASTDGIIQKDYLSLLERNRVSHAGLKYVSSSTYWVYRCLSTFADSPIHYDRIADAIKSIVECYRFERDSSLLGARDYIFHKAIYPFISLDNLQEIFFRGGRNAGSLTLPNKVYEKLGPLLKDDFQFLHQYAKCKLRISRRLDYESKDKRLDVLEQAKQFIERALGLAEESGGIHKEFTVAHMCVTKSLIMANYLRMFYSDDDVPPEELKRAIDSFFEVHVERREYLDDYFSSGKIDNEDSRWFMSQLVMPKESWRSIIRSDERCHQKVLQILRTQFPNAARLSFDAF